MAASTEAAWKRQDDPLILFQSNGRRDEHTGRGGLPHQSNLRRGEGVGLVDKVAEGALQSQGFGGEGAGGPNAPRVFLAPSLKPRTGFRK